jgi:hypothetical protein
MPEKTPGVTELNKEALVTYVERPNDRYYFYKGEGFRHERLPVGTRVIYSPPPLPAIPDLDSSIDEALENPLGCDPLSAQLRPGMKVTIAFDDISLPLPPMVTPDIRQLIIEKVLTKLGEHGIDDIHLIAALGLHRRMTPRELKRVLGSKVCNAFSSDRLYNFDGEDHENMVLLGETSEGEEVVLSKRVAESDLLIYVNVNLVSMDGGHKSITTGLVPYRTIRGHHNVHTLMNSTSYMDPPRSELHHSCKRMGAVVEEHVNVFKIETTLNTNTFPGFLRHLQKPEREWQVWEKTLFGLNMRSLNLMPYSLRLAIFQSIRSPFGVTGIAAGRTDQVHDYTLNNVFRQQMVPVKGQSDILVMGVPYLGPYNVNSFMNPILVHTNALGYLFNMYRGKPLVRRGGVLITMHPLDRRFHKVHHPSYIDFFDQVLSQTRNPEEIEKRFEESFATNPKYIDLYRKSYAYHGVHPFYMWYWACYAQSYLGRVIVVGARDKQVADTLGYDTASSLEDAFEMAKDTVGHNPTATMFHLPPVFMVDVE